MISEVPGYMKRTEIGGWDDPEFTRIGVMYDTDLMPFERTLAPGEEFTTAGASLLPFRNGDGFNDPHWRLPSYSAQVLERRVDSAGPPWIYNTWEPFERRINRDTTLELVEAAGAMGMDIFTIDDGWQQEYGENTVNLAAFPGGLEPILARWTNAACGWACGFRWRRSAHRRRCIGSILSGPRWARTASPRSPAQRPVRKR